MILYLIRHGRQNSSDCNVNVPLSEKGKLQAKLLGERMKRYPVDALYSSDLTRAVETAQIAFADCPELLLGHQIRSGIAEIDFGALTGIEDAKVQEYYRDYYKTQLDFFANASKKTAETALDTVSHYVGDFFVPPEEMWYPEGENGAMVLERAMPVVREWIASGKQNIAVVTHGGVIRVLLCALFGGNFSRRLQFGTSLENCSITQIHYEEEKNAFFLDRFNDYAHIETETSLLRHS